MIFNITSPDTGGLPRAGQIVTEHGVVTTPTYMPVGTFGPVRMMDMDELRQTGATIMLGNSLHLDQTAGSPLIEKMGWLAAFTGWNGPTLTDSGGYQVSFMWKSGTHALEAGERKHGEQSPIRKINDKGARVRSIVTNQEYLLTPELAMEVQGRIGADICMVFDQPTFDTDTVEAARATLKRAHDWMARSVNHWRLLRDNGQAPAWQEVFGIIQGGRHRELRRESAQFILDLNTFGCAIAGESIGIDPKVSAETVEMVRDMIPLDRPLYAMGLGGGPEGFFEAVRRGVDMFDNTSPTRMGRCGLALITPAAGGTAKNHFRLDLGKGKYSEDTSPIDATCQCKTCRQYTRGFLRHLVKIKEPLGLRLISYHNVWFMCELGRLMREAICAGQFDQLYREWLDG